MPVITETNEIHVAGTVALALELREGVLFLNGTRIPETALTALACEALKEYPGSLRSAVQKSVRGAEEKAQKHIAALLADTVTPTVKYSRALTLSPERAAVFAYLSCGVDCGGITHPVFKGADTSTRKAIVIANWSKFSESAEKALAWFKKAHNSKPAKALSHAKSNMAAGRAWNEDATGGKAATSGGGKTVTAPVVDLAGLEF